MKFKAFCAAAAAAAMSMLVPAAGHAAVNYVKVCDSFGAGYAYLPGSDVCVKMATGETAQETSDGPVYGKTPLAQSVDDVTSAVGTLESQVASLGSTSAATVAGLQQQISAVNAENQAINNRIDQIYDEIDKANEGSAVMGALPVPFIEAGHNFALAGNFAQFQSSGAFGLGGAIRVNSNLTFNGSVAVGDQQGTVGGRVGFNMSW